MRKPTPKIDFKTSQSLTTVRFIDGRWIGNREQVTIGAAALSGWCRKASVSVSELELAGLSEPVEESLRELKEARHSADLANQRSNVALVNACNLMIADEMRTGDIATIVGLSPQHVRRIVSGGAEKKT